MSSSFALMRPVGTSASGTALSTFLARRNAVGLTPFGTRSGTAESAASTSRLSFEELLSPFWRTLDPPEAKAGATVPVAQCVFELM